MCCDKISQSIRKMFFLTFLLILSNVMAQINPKDFKIWGPGLKPHKIIMPARYFFIEPLSLDKYKDTHYNVNVSGRTNTQKPCRIWKNILDRKDGSYIVRYKLYEPCHTIEINIQLQGTHLGKSPYIIKDLSYPDECECQKENINNWLDTWQCGKPSKQILDDLSLHSKIDWNIIRNKVIEHYNHPSSISICHYIIKSNMIYRKCYGKYVGFKMFMDNILLSLTRKIILPDNEFFINLGDWPLVKKSSSIDPIFSWCASSDTYDIVMPTYDITESTLENMGRVMLDMLSVQGNVEGKWDTRIPRVFWRGRDSRRERLDLVLLSRKYPELINASLTNFFFFREEEHIYGPKEPHASFFEFFNYKYQLNIDGTVAAYRFPYLLAGGSLVFKQNSQYYEHFYKELEGDVHYVSIEADLSDLIHKIKWAIDNDEKAKTIAQNGQKYAVENLLPKNIFCYYATLLNEFSKLIVSEVSVLEGMEKVEQSDKVNNCKCENHGKDEL